MDKQELIRRLIRTFLGELEGHIQAFDRDLMALETAFDPPARAETINALFRTAHSLKGSSRAVSVEILEAAAHRLETIFGEARDNAIVFSPETFQLMFRVVDGIKAVKAQLEAQKEVDRVPVAALLAELQTSFERPQGITACPPPTPPPPTPPPPTSPPAAAPPQPADPEPGAAKPEPPRSRPEPAAGEPAPSPFLRDRSRDMFVRVSSAKLDRMVALGGELLVARRRTDRRKAELDLLVEKARRLDAGWRAAERTLRDAERAGRKAASGRVRLDNAQRTMAAGHERLQSLLWQLTEFSAGMQADLRALDQVAEPLEDEVMKARMLPFAAICDGLGRALRDVAHETGKESVLVIEGGDLEINRSIAEAIKDPLLHLIRNAVDHGIESPAARLAAGKPARGRVTVSAIPRNGGIEIAVADDGGGFDLTAIRAQAQKRGLAVPEDDVEAAQLVFAPGFSTTSDVTVISGRGVGLDLVKNAVEAKRGRVEVQSIAGSGTRFTITMPFSLSMLPLLLVEAGGQTYGFDCSSVVGLRRIGIDAIHAVGGRDTILFEDVPVPLVSLADSLDAAAHEPAQVGGKVPVVILASGSDRAAFVVEELLAEQVVMVKDLGPRLRSVRGVNGATILPTGRIALVLNAADLVAMTRTRAPSRAMSQALDVAPAETRKRLLVVDDSITTRTLVQSILEATGFDVTAAVDGMEAWRMLQERGADLVVSDIEMPRMDGFALTEAIRTSRRFRDLPVILVTALESDEDRMRGLDAGADAYLRKSSFDQSQLIDTIRQLL